MKLTSRLALVSFLLAPLGAALAQQQRPPVRDEQDYRRLFKEPTNAAEFWERIKFEMDVGRFDLAGDYLDKMMKKFPTADELYNLHEKEGIAPFLRLRLVPRWNDDAGRQKDAEKAVESLIEKMTTAVRTKLNDPRRIKLFVGNLYATPEEVQFAKIELAKSGAAVVPFMLDELATRNDTSERKVILDTFSQLGHETVPPLLAALDIDDGRLRENILEVLRGRRDFLTLKGKGIEVAPFLWPLASSAQRSDRLRGKARGMLALLNNLRSPDLLPRAREALTSEAERYYHHRVRFGDPQRVSLWRWDGKRLVQDTNLTASKVEEYYGLRFARQALEIAAQYEPAQLIFLSLLLDKGRTAGAADQPLGQLKPNVRELLSKLNADLVSAALDGAMRDERTPVVLGAVQALGDLGDASAIRPGARGEPPLVRALTYGDRRVQMAAADSILRIPGAASTQATARIVEILKGALAPEAAASGKPRIMVAMTDQDYRNQVATAVRGIGAEPVLAATGRLAMRRLKQRADIDAVLTDSVLPEPGLAFLLGQLRADQGLRRLPVLLAVVPDSRLARDLFGQMRTLRAQLGGLEGDIQRRGDVARIRLDRYRLREELDPQESVLAEQRKKRERLEQSLLDLSVRYDGEAQRREDELRRYVEKFRHVWVVPANQLNDAGLLESRLQERLVEAGMPPLSKAERKEFAERALFWLARMATGEVRGFDVRPATDAVIGTLQGPPLSDVAMIDALRILGTLPGAKVQDRLIAVVVDGKRPVPVRSAAAEELQRSIQRFGRPLAAQERVLRAGLDDALGQAMLPAPLRERLSRLVGALRPDDTSTGQRLRDFKP